VGCARDLVIADLVTASDLVVDNADPRAPVLVHTDAGQ